MEVEILGTAVEVGGFPEWVQDLLVAYAAMDASSFEGFEAAQAFVYAQLADADCLYEVEELLGF
jgi:ABC-type uncharacterized transport system permease subunit